MKPFISTILLRLPLDTSSRAALSNAAQPVTFVTGQHLLSPGLVQSHLYFIEQGVVMSRCQNGKKEFINWFATEGDFVASVQSFHNQQTAAEYHTACTNVRAVAISKADYEALLHNIPMLKNLAYQLSLHYLRQSEHRMQQFLLLNAYDRYRQFAEERPDLLQRLPGKLIATYLGMTRFTLSKIRRIYRDKGGGDK
jgi:CRP-like cAMP-binding protein